MRLRRLACIAALSLPLTGGILAATAETGWTHNVVVKPVGVCDSQTEASFSGEATQFSSSEPDTVTVTIAGVSGTANVTTNGQFSVDVKGFPAQTGVVSFTWSAKGAVIPPGTPTTGTVDFRKCVKTPPTTVTTAPKPTTSTTAKVTTTTAAKSTTTAPAVTSTTAGPNCLMNCEGSTSTTAVTAVGTTTNATVAAIGPKIVTDHPATHHGMSEGLLVGLGAALLCVVMLFIFGPRLVRARR